MGTRRSRFLKRGIPGLIMALVVAVGQVSLGAVLPAAAKDDCTNVGNGNGLNGTAWDCEYDQYGPNSADWPNSPENDPHCYSQCYWWNTPNGGPGDVPASIAVVNSNNGQVKFHDDAKGAIYGWGGQPYNSPWMYDCTNNNSCSHAQVTFGAGNYDQNSCGVGVINSVDSYGRVLSAYANFNSQYVTYWDGPVPAGHTGCDAQSTAYHEAGHIFALGHSSDNADVMFWKDSGQASVTHGAQAGLNAIYGPYHDTDDTSGGCNSCQTSCPPEFQLVIPGHYWNVPTPCTSLYGYLSKAWSLSQGVSLPNPVSEISPSWCMPYYTSNAMLPWAECVVQSL
jgi:hypothetical protein